jgi:hypothetical protein
MDDVIRAEILKCIFAQLVFPFKKFWVAHKDLIESSSIRKYLTFDPESLQEAIKDLFVP